jgi:hypothetical protein
MATQIDWRRELDASFGSGDDLPVGHYVAAGHTAVRRRRAAVVAAGVAASIVVGTSWALAPGDAPRSDRAPVATEPTASASESASATASPSSPAAAPEPASSFPWRKGEPPARALPGRLEIRPGAVVHERRDDLYPGKDTESAALDISFRGERWWLVLEWKKGGSSMSSSRPEDGFAESFDAFVRAEVATGGMTSVPADDVPGMAGGLATWHGGELEPAPGVTVVRRAEDPVPGDDSLGLVLRSEGRTTWALFTQGGNASTWELETDSGWLTFDQWLADQVAVQTGSPGMRLVRLAADGTVSGVAPSVEVLEQQADPDLPAYGTDTASASAVALLDWQGERWFVLAVQLPREVAVTTFAASKTGGAETLDEFVAFVADQADEGGLR